MLIRQQSILALSFFLAVLLLGPPTAFSDDADNPRIRHIYTDEDAPSEIRFRLLLRMFSRDDDNQQERAKRKLMEIGFDATDIPHVQAYFELLYEQTQGEIDEGIWRIACQDGGSDLDGLEIRVVYNSFDDIRYAVSAKYLAIASAELAGMGYPEFGRMVERYPGQSGSFTTTSTDHRYAWGDSSEGIRENRANVCRGVGERLGRYYE